MKTETNLWRHREVLVLDSSCADRLAHRATVALAEFDEDHPEIIHALRAEIKAAGESAKSSELKRWLT